MSSKQNSSVNSAISFFFLVTMLASSCANIVSPTGGPKDTHPPKTVESIPKNLTTRFTGNIITITFDEYIRLENLNQEVIISPAIYPEPEITVKGRKLTIDLKGAVLDSNTTYTLNFGESIKDVNESNILANYQYVFSTGNIVDSLYIYGSIFLAIDQKPASKVLVMLHRDLSDSAFVLKKPFYFTKSDANGTFRFEHISPGRYKLYALKDENFNYLFDLPNEELAFTDSALTVDSNISGIRLHLFREERIMPVTRTALEDVKPGYFRLMFSKDPGQIEVISFEDSANLTVNEFNLSRDTVTAWFIHPSKRDSVLLLLNADSSEHLVLRNIPKDPDSLKNIFPRFSFQHKDSLIGIDGAISSTLNHPVKMLQADRVVVQQDSPHLQFKPDSVLLEEGSLRRILVHFPRKSGTGYTIHFPDSTFTNYFEMPNDSLLWRVHTRQDEEYGNLVITIKGKTGHNYILQLINIKGSSAVKDRSFYGEEVLEFKKMQPALLEIRVVYDYNKNGRWDTGNYLLHRQPERVYVHPEHVNIRANWDLEVELMLKD